MTADREESLLSERDKEFAYAYLADRESYHAQKETSAHAVFLVETGLFGALIATNTIGDFLGGSGNGVLLVLVVVFVWCLLHMFMRWQLRNRRIAAIQVGALILALTDHLGNRERAREDSKTVVCSFERYLDYVVPRPKSTYQGDVQIEEYPAWYRERYAIVQERTKASFGEIFPTYGSILILLASLLRVSMLWHS